MMAAAAAAAAAAAKIPITATMTTMTLKRMAMKYLPQLTILTANKWMKIMRRSGPRPTRLEESVEE
jgi:hypothetical protein